MNEHVKSRGNPFIAFFRGIFTGVILALYLLALTLIPALLIWAMGGVLMGAIATSAPMSIGKFVFPAVDRHGICACHCGRFWCWGPVASCLELSQKLRG